MSLESFSFLSFLFNDGVPFIFYLQVINNQRTKLQNKLNYYTMLIISSTQSYAKPRTPSKGPKEIGVQKKPASGQKN